jgi:hypothetical protein
MTQGIPHVVGYNATFDCAMIHQGYSRFHQVKATIMVQQVIKVKAMAMVGKAIQVKAAVTV